MKSQEILTNATVETIPDVRSRPPYDMAPRGKFFRSCTSLQQPPTWDLLLGRWRLSLDLFGRVFMEDVGLEPGSIVLELRGFPVKEARFRRHMEKIRSAQQRDLSLSKMERNRTSLLLQTFKELNTHFGNQNRRLHPPLAFNRVKVTFKDEPGEGSGVARSFYTSIAEAILANEKLPNLDIVQPGATNPPSNRYGFQHRPRNGHNTTHGGTAQASGSNRDIASSSSASSASSSSSSRRFTSGKTLWRPGRELKRTLNYDARPYRPIVSQG